MPSVWRCVRALAFRSMKWKARCLLSHFVFAAEQLFLAKTRLRRGGRRRRLNFPLAPGVALPGFGILSLPLGSSSDKPRGARQPCALEGLGSPVPICTQADSLQLGASLRLLVLAGRCGIFLAALPRVPYSAEAWLARPLKRRKILLSAHFSRSVKSQSIQQQPSVVCCLQPCAASAPTHVARSLGHQGWASPSHPLIRATTQGYSSLRNTICSIQQWGAKDGCAGKRGGGLWADPPPSLCGELRLPLQPAKPHIIRAGKVVTHLACSIPTASLLPVIGSNKRGS